MRARIWAVGVVLLIATSAASADTWYLEEPQQIEVLADKPSLRNGTIAFVDTDGGAVYFYPGSPPSVYIYGPNLYSYEPVHANDSIGWRNCQDGAGTNDIYRYDWVTVTNVSNSPGIVDSDLSAGSNGDLIWSRAHAYLMYYDASEDATVSLGIQGQFPTLYITDGGTATYAWQDNSTKEVKYYDGSVTHTLGDGASSGAYPSLHDGCVGWVGTGVGGTFKTGEIFLWKDGVTTRVTNDDAVNGVADSFPSVWDDKVIWSRNGPWAPRLWIWDGEEMTQLTTSGGAYPSYRQDQVAYRLNDGMYLASVVRATGACCFLDGTCIVALEEDCQAAGGTYDGDFTDCDPNPCPQPTGACCFPDGDCEVEEAIECANHGGAYQGDFTDCVPNPCPQPPGACCFEDGTCQMLTEQDCLLSHGRWEDAETSCNPNPCEPPEAACCFADGSCTMLTEALCLCFGGDWQGVGIKCRDNPCPPPLGACCLAGYACQVLTEEDCEAAYGVWLGYGTDCDPNPCTPPPPGACCFEDGACIEVSADECGHQGGLFQGESIPCKPNPCPQPQGACCTPSGGCTVMSPIECELQLGDWVGADVDCDPDPCLPQSPGDLNCDGRVNQRDLRPFVDALLNPTAYHAHYPACNILNGDLNEDYEVDGLDVQFFVDLLIP